MLPRTVLTSIGAPVNYSYRNTRLTELTSVQNYINVKISKVDVDSHDVNTQIAQINNFQTTLSCLIYIQTGVNQLMGVPVTQGTSIQFRYTTGKEGFLTYTTCLHLS